MGPTASGKTQLAMDLYQQFPCDIISVDSALVYRGMDIGTAKPSLEELQAYPHALVDIREVTEPYSAANFREDTLALCQQSLKNSRIPLLVGGTMLYFKALMDGLNQLPSADEKLRGELEMTLKNKGIHYLHDRLAQVDPESAQRIHPNDPQRTLRALEIFEVSGKTMTELTRAQIDAELPFEAMTFIVAPEDRKVLHARIEKRWEQMLASGFEDEVRKLWQMDGVHEDLPAIKSVGYRQMWQYLAGELSHDEMRERALIATRQLAKRQMTWLRSWSKEHSNCHWLDPQAPHFEKMVEKKINNWLF